MLLIFCVVNSTAKHEGKLKHSLIENTVWCQESHEYAGSTIETVIDLYSYRSVNVDMSPALGMYWRSMPLVYSLVPRRHANTYRRSSFVTSPLIGIVVIASAFFLNINTSIDYEMSLRSSSWLSYCGFGSPIDVMNVG
jgi:hypothetical protein